MIKLYKGKIVDFSIDKSLECVVLSVEDFEGKLQKIPCRNPSTVHYIQHIFGWDVHKGCIIKQKKYINQDIYYTLNNLGSLDVVIPVEDSTPGLEKVYQKTLEELNGDKL